MDNPAEAYALQKSSQPKVRADPSKQKTYEVTYLKIKYTDSSEGPNKPKLSAQNSSQEHKPQKRKINLKSMSEFDITVREDDHLRKGSKNPGLGI